MNSVIDVGGGLRAIYSAGVFDRCIDENVSFDICIGVSAGSANISSFLAGQKGRNYRFYAEYSQRKEYMSMANFIKKGSYIDLDFIYSVLTNSDGEDPICFENIKNSTSKMFVVATNAETGKPHYFSKQDMNQDDYKILNASSCLPFVCKPVKIGDKKYFDGGLSDPNPLDLALENDCDKIVLILTKPRYVFLDSKRNKLIAGLISRKYPESAKALERSHEKYNAALKKAIELEKDGKLLLIAPDDCCGLKTLTKDKKKLDMMYSKGYNDAIKIIEFLK